MKFLAGSLFDCRKISLVIVFDAENVFGSCMKSTWKVFQKLHFGPQVFFYLTVAQLDSNFLQLGPKVITI